MYQNPDRHIREYTLKRQQQKARAKQLRDKRRNQEYVPPQPDSRQRKPNQSRRNSLSRIVGDPLAVVDNNYKENRQTPNPPLQKQHQYNGYPNPLRACHQDPTSYDSTTQLQQRTRQPNNDAQMHKLFSMISELSAQMSMQQSQIQQLSSDMHVLKQQKECSPAHNNYIMSSRHNHHQHEAAVNRKPIANVRKSYPSAGYQNLHNDSASSCSSHRSYLHLPPNHGSQSQRGMNKSITKSLANLKLRSRRQTRPSPRTTAHAVHERRDDSVGSFFSEAKSHEEVTQGHLGDAPAALQFVDKLSGMSDTVQNIQRVPCRQCGRKFIESALQRHLKICKNVFGSKRKVFDTTKQRLDSEAKQAHNSSSSDDYKMKAMKRKKKASWKAKSARLRAAISSCRGEEEGNSMYGQSATQQFAGQDFDDRVTCPHCNRRFAEQTAERHIPKCRDIIAKPRTLRRGLR